MRSILNRINTGEIVKKEVEELLWEYIQCLQKYCTKCYQNRFLRSASISAEELDRFIVVLRSLKRLLQAVTYPLSTPEHNQPPEKKKNRNVSE